MHANLLELMLKSLSEDLWHVEYARKAGGLQIPCRMVVVRLPNGQLWLHSPVPIDNALAAALQSLGAVGHVVAPNGFHYLYTAACRRRYPQARFYAVTGLPKRLPSFRFDEVLTGQQTTHAWQGVFEQCVIHGFPWPHSEVVFLHRPTRTVIVTDLVIDTHTLQGRPSCLVRCMVCAYRRMTQGRLWRCAMVRPHQRAATRDAVAQVLSWDVKRLVMSHGEVVEDQPRKRLYQELRWAC